MCGIFGYIGKKEAKNILIEGLESLEYRGYDSAGVAIVEDDEINEFFKSHDVIQVDHLPDCYTTVIYRESVGSDD